MGLSRGWSAAARDSRAMRALARSEKIGSAAKTAGLSRTADILALIAEPTLPERAAAAQALMAAGMAWGGTPRLESWRGFIALLGARGVAAAGAGEEEDDDHDRQEDDEVGAAEEVLEEGEGHQGIVGRERAAERVRRVALAVRRGCG